MKTDNTCMCISTSRHCRLLKAKFLIMIMLLSFWRLGSAGVSVCCCSAGVSVCCCSAGVSVCCCSVCISHGYIHVHLTFCTVQEVFLYVQCV